MSDTIPAIRSAGINRVSAMRPGAFTSTVENPPEDMTTSFLTPPPQSVDKLSSQDAPPSYETSMEFPPLPPLPQVAISLGGARPNPRVLRVGSGFSQTIEWCTAFQETMF